jgi:predicted nucleic acid-binding protein
MTKLKLFLISLLILSVLLANTAQAEDRITEAYKAVLDADRAGGNITALVEKLNRAIEIRDKDPETAIKLANEVIAESRTVKEQGLSSAQQSLMVKSAALASLLALAGVTYFYLPRVMWRFWLRHRKGWRLKK